MTSTSTEKGNKEKDKEESHLQEEPPLPSLPKLLSALALGARSVNSLPLSKSNDSSKQKQSEEEEDDEEEEEEEGEDDFLYQMAFPEFNSLCKESRSKLVSLLYHALDSSCHELTDGILPHHQNHQNQEYEVEVEFDNPLLWERAAEACDVLLEKVDVYIQDAKEGNPDDLGSVVERVKSLAKKKARFGWSHMMDNLVEMEKPQIVYDFTNSVQNSRTEPFTPQLHPNKQSSSPLQLKPGHGLDTKHYDGGNTNSTTSSTFRPLPSDVIAPKHHCAHLYEEEIKSFPYDEQRQLELDPSMLELVKRKQGRGGTLHNPNLSSKRGTYVDTEEGLIKLVERIHKIEEEEGFVEIAVDLEAHSYRSFNGFLCLMQISLRRPDLTDESDISKEDGYDHLVDTLKLHHVMNEHMAPIFSDPKILKVMHGADSDVPWLQRDFGIYVVNLFDTGRAARLLPNFRPSLAYLLMKYADVEADKKHQLSDWRQRPLPDEMRAYAVSDTQYLLDIYDKLRLELMEEGKKDGDVSIKAVLDASRKVCLIRFSPEPFKPSGYKKLITSKRGKKKNNLGPKEEELLKYLHDWRDQIAREEDESIQYVCPDSGLLRIAGALPGSVTELQGLINPLPPYVLSHASQILQLVSNVKNTTANDHGATPLPRRKANEETPATKRSGMLSPVLGTEALYKQAGWMTPQIDKQNADNGGVTSSTEDEDNTTMKVEVHEANQNFDSSRFSSHSLEMGSSTRDGTDAGSGSGGLSNEKGRGKTVDGLGAARSAMNEGQGRNDTSSRQSQTIEMETDVASNCAKSIRDKMLNENLLGIVNASIRIENEGVTGNVQNDKEGEGDDINDETLNDMKIDEMPKSMQEIYRISYRNRRRAKKSTTPEIATSKNTAELEQAEALLAKSGPDGTDYFEDAASNKRQRKGDDNSQATNSASNKEADIALMKELGWVKDKAEAESLIASNPESNDNGEETNDQKRNTKAKKQNDNYTSGDQQMKPIKEDQKRTKDNSARHPDSSLPHAFTNARGVYDPNAAGSENPFFAGAAIGGGTLNKPREKGGRKKSGTNNKKGKKGNGGDRGGKKDNNKTYVYRS